MHDQKINAPLENMPIPGKLRGGTGTANMNNHMVTLKREMQHMSKTITDLTELVLRMSDTIVRIEKKLDTTHARYEALLSSHDLVPRPASDGVLSYVDVPRTDGSADGGPSIDGGSSDTGSLISMGAMKVDEEEPRIDTSVMPPGVREAVNENYFDGAPASTPAEEVIAQEVIEEDIVEEVPLVLSRAVVAELATPSRTGTPPAELPSAKPADVPSAVEPPVAEDAPAADPPAAEEDIDKLVAELANTSDADIAGFTAAPEVAPVAEPPKPVKKRATAAAKPKTKTPRKPRKPAA